MRWRLTDPYVLGGLALVGGVVWYYTREGDVGDVPLIGPVLAPLVGKGSRVTSTTIAHGFIADDPQALAAEAGVAADVYALARMIRSEGAKAGNARAHVALNDLRSLGWSSLLYLMTYCTDPARKGYFGEQYAAPDDEYPRKASRRYATSKDPYQADLVAAQQAIEEHLVGIDPTGGAVKFLDISSFGKQTGTGKVEKVIAEWGRDGLVASTMPEYGDDFLIFRKA